MPNSNSRARNDRSDRGVMEMARERPIAAAAAAASAAAAGLFLWSKRHQISQQISDLSDQIGEWTDTMGSSGNGSKIDDTAGLTTAKPTRRSGAGSRSASAAGARTTAKRNRSMSESGGRTAQMKSA